MIEIGVALERGMRESNKLSSVVFLFVNISEESRRHLGDLC